MVDVIICWTRSIDLRMVAWCPTCEQRRRCIATQEVWYDPDLTCLTCGERWDYYGIAPRPFMRGWRKQSAESARRRWAEALPAPEAREAFFARVQEEMAT